MHCGKNFHFFLREIQIIYNIFSSWRAQLRSNLVCETVHEIHYSSYSSWIRFFNLRKQEHNIAIIWFHVAFSVPTMSRYNKHLSLHS